MTNGKGNSGSRWVSVANPSQGEIGGGDFEGEQGSRRRYIPSKDKLRKWAKESNDGGRATCEVCYETFAMYYMRICKIGIFKTGHVCIDCKKERGLQQVR